MRSFIRSKVMEGVPNFKFRSRDPDHAHFMGQFVVHWLVHVTFNLCTKCEVSIFNYSKDIRVPKFKIFTWPTPRPFRVKFSYFDNWFHATY